MKCFQADVVQEISWSTVPLFDGCWHAKILRFHYSAKKKNTRSHIEDHNQEHIHTNDSEDACLVWWQMGHINSQQFDKTWQAAHQQVWLNWDVGITVEHNILQALTNSFQHCRCLSGRISFNAKVENTTAQFLNWSAVKPLKFDAILDWIRPILDGTFNLLILLWRWLNSFSLSKFSSFQILSIFLVVPNIKLCMGSITTNEIKSK